MARRRGPSLVTKKHLARAERERILTRYVLISAGAVLVLVLGLIGYGIVEENYIQPSQPVAFVNGAPITGPCRRCGCTPTSAAPADVSRSRRRPPTLIPDAVADH